MTIEGRRFRGWIDPKENTIREDSYAQWHDVTMLTHSLLLFDLSIQKEKEKESLVTYSWDSSFPEIEREEERDFKVVAELSGFAIR